MFYFKGWLKTACVVMNFTMEVSMILLLLDTRGRCFSCRGGLKFVASYVTCLVLSGGLHWWSKLNGYSLYSACLVLIAT